MILVLVETQADGVELLSAEALTFARGIAASGDGDVQALVVGPHPAVALEGLAAHGVSAVHHADDERLATYSAAAWAAAAVDAAKATGATTLLAAASPRGNEVLAHVAARLDLAMAANAVTADAATAGTLVVRRQVMGGAALEEVHLAGTAGAPALVTMAGHAVDPEPAAAPSSPSVSVFAPALTDADLVARVVRSEPVVNESGALTTSRVVVGAGRGVGGADQFGDLLELTELLGGALGVSRVVTSLGWRPHHEQVGQTGSRVSPDLYLACGISGAIQHWAGMSSAKTIIAINTDDEAPMVTKAHYAVIGDLHEIVPAVNAEIRKRKG
ncbi:MAG: electron transfer flavoprotein subunit alpha/FixB family protein [Actinobacteria bacterium]|nr:electron transfer flavoprotein subunit alpha/FixB family protein [Actinomycetota bacterium]